jgi:hypothetical protein
MHVIDHETLQNPARSIRDFEVRRVASMNASYSAFDASTLNAPICRWPSGALTGRLESRKCRRDGDEQDCSVKVQGALPGS